jgi:threonine dehydratase
VALGRIEPHVLRTPVEPSPWLSSLTGCSVHLKLESEQRTGSFKARGAVNKASKSPPLLLLLLLLLLLPLGCRMAARA